MNGKEGSLESFQQRLSKMIRQIPLGVRKDDVGKTLNIYDVTDIQGYINDSMTSKLDMIILKGFKKIWTHYQLPEKLTYLKHLEDTSPKKPSWRPITGKATGNVVVAECLKKRKELLQEELTLTQEKSEELQAYLISGYEQTKKQIKEFEAIQENFKD